MLLDLPRDVIRSVAHFRLCVHTLCVEIATWNSTSSPTCDLCEADDNIQDEKHVLFHCMHPQMVSLRRKCGFLFSQTGQDASAFIHQENNRLLFSTMNLFYFMNRRAVILFD